MLFERLEPELKKGFNTWVGTFVFTKNLVLK